MEEKDVRTVADLWSSFMEAVSDKHMTMFAFDQGMRVTRAVFYAGATATLRLMSHQMSVAETDEQSEEIFKRFHTELDDFEVEMNTLGKTRQ